MSGKDSLSFAKVVAAVMVLLGVYLVSKRPIRGF
jgi:hypothetical protein